MLLNLSIEGLDCIEIICFLTDSKSCAEAYLTAMVCVQTQADAV